MKNFFKTVWEIIKDFAKNNWAMKIISLVFAFIVWCSVVAGTNPDRIKVVNNVPLQVVGVEELEAKGLCVDTLLSEIPEEVNVSVRAGLDYHSRIDNSSVTARIDLSTVNEEGEAEIDVNCSVSVGNSTIVSTDPSTVTLSIDRLATKTIPITAKIADESQDGYYVSSVETINDQITISGPKNKIDQVASGIAYISVSDITESKRISAPVTLVDSEGNELDGILTNEDSLYTIVEVDVLPTKDISISADSIENAIINVANNYEIYGAVATPAVITIAGEQDTIDSVTDLQFEIIDVQGADKSVVVDARLKDIDGVTYVDSQTISVYVQIREKTDTITFSNQSIEVRNVTDGYSAYISGNNRCNVTVTGPLSSLKNITNDDVRPYIDAYGLSDGRFERTVEIDAIAGINSDDIEISVEQIAVVIQRD